MSPVPPSTLFIPDSEVHLSQDVKLAVILQVLRYVSHKPWGGASSQSFRRTRSLEAIMSRVFKAQSSERLVDASFSAGSGVLWVPVIRTPAGRILTRNATFRPSYVFGWLAQRLPSPTLARANKHAGVVSFCEEHAAGSANHKVWLEGQLLATNGRQTLRFLFDCRFVLELDLRYLPHDTKSRLGTITHITLLSNGKYALPCLKLVGVLGEEVIWKCSEEHVLPDSALPLETKHMWITVKPARTLTTS